MTYKTLTPSQFLAEARAWDAKCRAMRRAAFFNAIFDTSCAVFSLAFIAFSFLIFTGPGVMAVAAFFGVPMP